MVELQKIATEQRNPNTMNIDTLSTLDIEWPTRWDW